MNSKEIKRVFAEFEVVKAKALLIVETVGTIPEGYIHPDDVSIEEKENGLYFGFYYKGDDQHVIIPWWVFDQGVEKWKEELEEKERYLKRQREIEDEERRRKTAERDYQLYLVLKSRFEPENS